MEETKQQETSLCVCLSDFSAVPISFGESDVEMQVCICNIRESGTSDLSLIMEIQTHSAVAMYAFDVAFIYVIGLVLKVIKCLLHTDQKRERSSPDENGA